METGHLLSKKKKKKCLEAFLEKENKERVEESQCCRERRGVRSIRGSF